MPSGRIRLSPSLFVAKNHPGVPATTLTAAGGPAGAIVVDGVDGGAVDVGDVVDGGGAVLVGGSVDVAPTGADEVGAAVSTRPLEHAAMSSAVTPTAVTGPSHVCRLIWSIGGLDVAIAQFLPTARSFPL
jgi:hypothetical protein